MTGTLSAGQIADGTYNMVSGSYVARIYKSVTLSEDGTEVVDSKKLHKYDGAFYSKMSLNVNGGFGGRGQMGQNGRRMDVKYPDGSKRLLSSGYFFVNSIKVENVNKTLTF